MSEEKNSHQQFLLGLFGGVAVIAVIGLIVLGVILMIVMKNGGAVAGQTETNANVGANQTPAATVANKTDKPTVDLFVMSHCPYGTQIEKGMIPVAEKLAGKINFSVKFVYYAMHGEVEIKEQLNQHCIQAEQSDKYLSYLKCFLGSGDGASCLASTGIDTGKLSACAAKTDTEFSVSKNLADKAGWLSGKYPKFDVNLADNQKYNVGGSPTLIINGQDIESGRDAASLLKVVCSAFKKAPKECGDTLSSAQPSAGFGYDEAGGAATGAACGN